MKHIQSRPLDAEWEAQYQAFMDAVESEAIPYEAQLPLARQFVWEQINGYRVPPGYWIRHSCSTRECVNPSHAVLVKAG